MHTITIQITAADLVFAESIAKAKNELNQVDSWTVEEVFYVAARYGMRGMFERCERMKEAV